MTSVIMDTGRTPLEQQNTSFNVTPLPESQSQFFGTELGCLRNCYHLQPEDPMPSGKELYAEWQDPFRMSVLDFQHLALDKLAEVMRIFLESRNIKLKSEEREDVQALIHRLSQGTNDFVVVLGYKDRNAFTEVCKTLREVRTNFAHQKYIKSHNYEQDIPEKYKKIRTFEHTRKVIMDCTDFTKRVTKIQDLSEEKKREVRIRHSDLKSLNKSFEEFSIYRVREKNSIETFSEYFDDEWVMKEVAKEVLAKLNSRIKKDEDSSDLCKLLVCVFAPRCSLEIAKPKSTTKKLEEQAKNIILVIMAISIVIVFLLQFTVFLF